MSTNLRKLFVAFMLSIATMSVISTTIAQIVHAEEGDCKPDDEKPECKKD